MSTDATPAVTELRARVDGLPGWYHTFDLTPGVTTPGRLDFRPALSHLPWPNVRRKRCLDLGTLDGFFAFELERQGAAEVVAIDVEEDPRRGGGSDGATNGACFELAAEAIGSRVERHRMSVYDLDPAGVGRFDVVLCSGLLRQLRDPNHALEAIRSITDGPFLSIEQIELWLSLVGRGRPLFTLDRTGGDRDWFRANGTAHKHLLWAAGFEVERISRPFAVPRNRAPLPPATLPNRIEELAIRVITGESLPGVLHRALLARASE